MNRLDAMRDRLPPVWSSEEGTLTRSVLGLIATAMAVYDEDMDRVQRSHWVDTAFDIADLAKIGALFQIAMAPWESEALYRARLKATIAARLRGAVTRDVLEFVLTAILGGARAATGSRYADLPAAAGNGIAVFDTGPDGPPDRLAFVEFPARRRRSQDLLDGGALRRPLAKITIENTGLFPAALKGVIRGVAGQRTMVPLIANLTNGQVMVWADHVRCGRALIIGTDDDGAVTAEMDGKDVSDRLYTGDGFAPGEGFEPILPDPEPRPLMIERGTNTLWVMPLALYDAPSLGSASLAMPEEDLTHGRWSAKDGTPPVTRFGKALFEQPPAMSLDLWIDEATPATFRFLIPAGAVRRRTGQAIGAVDERERLFSLMQETVADLRAAGIDGRVQPRPFRERQRLGDRVSVLNPKELAETQPLESRLAGLPALFDISAIDGARFE